MDGDGMEKTMADLKEAVALVAARQGFKKPSFDIQSGSKAGDGFSGLLYRVNIQESEEESSSCFCPKSRPQRDDLVVMCKLPMPKKIGFMLAGGYTAEGIAYTKILPSIQEILGMAPWPRFYHIAPDDKPCIVLSDLRPEGFVMANRRVAMDEAHCRLALKRLAQFHGGGMAMLNLRPAETKGILDSVPNPMQSLEMQDMMGQFPQQIAKALALFQDRFPQGAEVHGKIMARLALMGQEMPRMFAMQPGSQPGMAIIHGDCHVNNVMFKYDEAGGVVDCRLIDFQLCRAGDTAMDVVSLLLPCTEKATRDAHWETLLRGYHDELQRVLRAAGCDPDAVYSWQDLQTRMQEASFFGFIIAPMILNATLADERAAEEIREMLHDVEKMKAGGIFDGINPNEELKRRLGDVVQSLLDWGWL